MAKRKRLYFSGHGGHCCGIIHLFGFDRHTYKPGGIYVRDDNGGYARPLVYNFTDLKERCELVRRSMLHAIKSHYTNVWGRGPTVKNMEKPQEYPVLIEVCITDHQKEFGRWGKTLEALNFKCVSSFKNANSGNVVNVYHLHTKDLPEDASN